MRVLVALILIAIAAGSLAWGQQSFSLPKYPAIHCSALQNNCYFPLVYPGTTGIIVARQAQGVSVTDNHGNTYVQDQCTNYDNGDCAFHVQFTVQENVQVSFSGGAYDVYMLLYDGTWDYVKGQIGDYSTQNYPFSDCTNGQSCPYYWTLPIETDAGNLLISWGNANAAGTQLFKPGFGYTMEGSDGVFCVEDMIAPVGGVYFGNLESRLPDGSENGGSHWLMGLAAYKRR